MSILLDAFASDVFDEIASVDLISATKRQIARSAAKAVISKIRFVAQKTGGASAR